MAIALVTGSSGLIGSETCKFLSAQGMDVVGIDNDMRQYFFGAEASTAWNTKQLEAKLPSFRHHAIDIRDQAAVDKLMQELGKNVTLVVHTAAQPSHDWAAREPFTDFTVNANGTLVMLEATRKHAPDAVFIFTSTNKVYGDTPNLLPLVEKETRWELDEKHAFAKHGIDESMSIDQSKHSLFGASKVAADVLAQEYGRYFGLRTGTFRGGCLTGPAHSGAELHGFLAYLVKCVVIGKPYTIFGYKGKQVRDNIHSYDLVNAFWHFYQNPRPGEVYNMGGSRHSNCSMLEAIRDTEALVGRKLDYRLDSQARAGDHIWYVSDVRKFEGHYPGWKYKYDHPTILKEIVDATQERSAASKSSAA
jgi:CDP-paratose 2-epimerase